MATKMMLAPKISEPGMPGFLLWARRDNPALYSALVRQFPAVQQFDAAIRSEQGLAGIADVLKTIGGSLAKSASSIGSFVAKNALTIATAAVPIIVAKKQADVAKLQVKVAQAQQPPLQTAVQYDAEGNAHAVPVRQTTGAMGSQQQQNQLQLDEAGMQRQPSQAVTSVVKQLASFKVGGVPLWGIAAGLGVFVAVRMMRRR